MGEGRSTPRPPRRVPSSVATLTQLQSATPRPAEPPPRQPWIFGRILAGIVALLVVIAGGATAGWWIRSQSVHLGTPEVLGTVGPEVKETVGPEVLQAAGPAVVRVLATTCAGTGEATGAVVEDGRVITAASAIREPLSIVIVTPNGTIHRANLLGTSADGVAVLRLIGRFDATPLPLASTDPDPNAERALIGYTAAGKQTMQPIGSVYTPTPLSSVMNITKLGGPVVEKSGQVVGVAVGDKVANSRIVDADKLRGYVAPGSTGITAKLGECTRSRGPLSPVAPELQVASTPLAREVQQMLASYLTFENRHDFEAVQPLYSKRLAKTLTVDKDRKGHQTSYFFLPKITGLTRIGTNGVAARVSLNVLFSPGAQGSGGQNCNRLDYRYELVRQDGELVLDRTVAMSKAQPCATE